MSYIRLSLGYSVVKDNSILKLMRHFTLVTFHSKKIAINLVCFFLQNKDLKLTLELTKFEFSPNAGINLLLVRQSFVLLAILR